MKMQHLLFFVLIPALVFSCSSKMPDNQVPAVQSIEIEERVAIPESKASVLLEQLRPERQVFEFEATADFSIQTEGHNQVYIPKNSFVGEDGATISGKVKLEMMSILNARDFVKANLQTVSDGRVLQSEGMLFIDVTAAGKPVTLAPGKKLQIELSKINTYSSASDIRIFTGKHNASGNINWTEKSKIDKKLLPLPLDMFSYKTRTSLDFNRVSPEIGYRADWDSRKNDTTTFKH